MTMKQETQATNAIEKVIYITVNGLVFTNQKDALEYKQSLYEK